MGLATSGLYLHKMNYVVWASRLSRDSALAQSSAG